MTRWLVLAICLAACGADGLPEERAEGGVSVSGEATIGVRGEF